MFYDRKQKHVWISPNGAVFFIPGAPCDGYFISNYCYLTTDQYEAFHAPLLADFVFLLIPGVPGRTQPSLRTALSNTVGIMITLWSAGKKFPSTTSLKPSNPSCFPLIVTEVPTTFTNQYPFFPSLLFVQVDFTYPAQHQQGLVGARPFLTLGNYTYRSPFIPSSYNNWYVLSRGST